MTAASLLYVLWLALRIFRLGLREPDAQAPTKARLMSFFEAMLFQWVNGKAWQMALIVATLYAAPDHLPRLLEASAVAGLPLVSGLFWIELGKRIAGLLRNPTARKVYFTLLTLALLLSTLPVGVRRLLEFWGRTGRTPAISDQNY